MPDISNYQFGAVPNNLLDFVKSKQKSSKYYFQYLFARTQKMFEYHGLPDSIDSDVLERYLQLNGATCITKYKDKLYCFAGSVGGIQDVYYKPSLFVVSNPHLDDGFSKNIIITRHRDHLVNLPTDSQDGVLMRNDTEWVGLTPLIARYAVLMAENTLTVRSADVMLRIIPMISAPNDKVLKSAMDYLKRLENGEFGVIGDSQFSEGIKMQSPPSNNGSYLTQFIELQQYLKGSFFGELGLRANYNMKREAIGTGESTLDEDSILPLCDNMLMCRRQDIEQVNSLYGTDISVNFSSAWLRSHIENDNALISQVLQSGVAELGNSELTSDEMGQDGTEMGQDGSSGDYKEGVGENGTDTADEENGRRDTDDSGVESSSNGDTNKSSAGENSGTGEGAEVRDISEDRRTESENNTEIDDDSCINDLMGEEVVDEVEEVIEEACEELSVGKGVQQNEFLGQSEGSGNEEDSSDGKRDIQQDELSVENGDNS